jgi:hypothetical protein
VAGIKRQLARIGPRTRPAKETGRGSGVGSTFKSEESTDKRNGGGDRWKRPLDDSGRSISDKPDANDECSQPEQASLFVCSSPTIPEPDPHNGTA